MHALSLTAGPLTRPAQAPRTRNVDFEFSEHHALLRRSVREFAKAEIAPHAQAWDREERFPRELVPKLASMGLLGIRIPEEYGGSGMDTTSYAICVEEIARVDGSMALTVASHNGLGTGHVLSFGNDAQKRRYLPKAASGEEVQNVFSVELTTDGKVRVDSAPVASDEAIAELAKQAKARNKDMRVVIRADKKVEHGRVIRVLDILKQAGLAKFAFGVAPAPRDDAAPAPAPN